MEQVKNSKVNTANGSSKAYDLEERTFAFAKECRDFVTKLPKDIANREYAKQLVRSSASIGANYIEAREALSKKDFTHRVRISRKETKETIYWLKLVVISEDVMLMSREELVAEGHELLRILSSIVEKTK